VLTSSAILVLTSSTIKGPVATARGSVTIRPSCLLKILLPGLADAFGCLRDSAASVQLKTVNSPQASPTGGSSNVITGLLGVA
jgi:hypothetical protein